MRFFKKRGFYNKKTGFLSLKNGFFVLIKRAIFLLQHKITFFFTRCNVIIIKLNKKQPKATNSIAVIIIYDAVSIFYFYTSSISVTCTESSISSINAKLSPSLSGSVTLGAFMENTVPLIEHPFQLRHRDETSIGLDDIKAIAVRKQIRHSTSGETSYHCQRYVCRQIHYSNIGSHRRECIVIVQTAIILHSTPKSFNII